MSARFEVRPERHQSEPRVRARVAGHLVTYREGFGWRCQCNGRGCRHVRAVAREIPAWALERFREETSRRGWYSP